MTNKFKIEFRKQQLYLEYDINQPVTVSCDVNGQATYIPGLTAPNDWIDVTDYTEGLEKLKLTWQAFTSDSSGSDQASANQFGSNYSKAISLELAFNRTAFQFIFDWLMTNPCQILNAVDVRLTDMDCGKEFRIFEIKVGNIQYAPFDAPCIVRVPLREQDLIFSAFQKTIIEDDWQGWFNSEGTSTKEHPTFMYVVEKRPHFILSVIIMLAYMAGGLSGGLLNAFDFYKRWIRRILGICYFSPAPLIRTYIVNMCDKYGYSYDTMFDDVPGNEYRDLCMFYPVETFEKNFDDFTALSTIYNYDNRTGMAFTQFLDKLKKVVNAEWYVTPNNMLVFHQKPYFDNLPPIYDFTLPGAFPLYNFIYDFNGEKKPAYGDYQYRQDPVDSCSNDLKTRYNDIVDYDGPANNPMLEGSVTKNIEFASTGFVYDGDTVDFLEENIEAGRLVANIAIAVGLVALLALTNFFTAIVTAAAVTLGYVFTNNFINNFINNSDIRNAVRMASNVVNIPRLLLWNRETGLSAAKVVTVVNPPQNPYYNTLGQDYYTAHPAFDAPAGYFGSVVTEIANYPMFVDAKFTGNLFDRFLEYDNPFKNPLTNQNFEADLDLCCQTADIFGFYSTEYAKIGAVVIVENRNGRLIKARLIFIEPDYDKGLIHIKGTILK